MVCSAWFRERLRKASLKKENDMVQDIDIKSKRILLFDFDGTLIETASGNTFATDLTDMRIKMDVVNKALDLMQENGVKVFAIVSNQGGVEAGFVSGADIEAKIEYVLVRLARRHNRQIHKQKIQKGGIKRLNQSPFEVFGFRLFDRVMFENSYYFIFGRRKTGSFNIILMAKAKRISRTRNLNYQGVSVL